MASDGSPAEDTPGVPQWSKFSLSVGDAPIVLLASGAEHIYYGLRHHPVFSQVNQLLELLAKRASHRICIWESDGAYSNERLMGHVFHKEKSANTNHFNLHCKCQNHQTQLVNVALLACVGKDLLGRLYGMTQHDSIRKESGLLAEA